MPSNKPKTTYLNLPLYTLLDLDTSFSDYWQSINLEADGSEKDYSAFQLLDNAYHDIDLRILALPAQVKSEVADLFDQAMEEEY